MAKKKEMTADEAGNYILEKLDALASGQASLAKLVQKKPVSRVKYILIGGILTALGVLAYPMGMAYIGGLT